MSGPNSKINKDIIYLIFAGYLDAGYLDADYFTIFKT